MLRLIGLWFVVTTIGGTLAMILFSVASRIIDRRNERGDNY